MTTIKSYELNNGDKRYMFQVYVGVDPLTGKEKRTTRRGFKTKKEAQLALSRIQLEIDNGTFGKKVVETYEDVYKLWIEQYENKVEESTFEKTNRYFKHHILPSLGKYKIDKITVDICQKTVNEWFKHYKEYRRFKSYAAKIFEYAMKHNYVLNNPMKLVELPRKIEAPIEDEGNENFYDRDELIKFLSCLDVKKHYKQYAFFRLLAFSGMRKGEALALNWNDINFKDNEIRINKALARGKNNNFYVKTTKTKKSIRTIKMDEKTMAILAEWKKRQKQDYFKLGYNTLQPNQLLFSNRYNTFIHTSHPFTWISSVQTKHNLKKISIHGLRHTHCSLMFEAGASLQEVQERLGHENVQTTMNIYTHVTKKAKEEAIQKFAMYMDI